MYSSALEVAPSRGHVSSARQTLTEERGWMPLPPHSAAGCRDGAAQAPVDRLQIFGRGAITFTLNPCIERYKCTIKPGLPPLQSRSSCQLPCLLTTLQLACLLPHPGCTVATWNMWHHTRQTTSLQARVQMRTLSLGSQSP